MREEGGGLLVGPFEADTVTWAADGVPEDFHSSLLPPALDRGSRPVFEGCARRLPLFEDAGIQTIVNGPDGYTPDGHCLMGPVPGLDNFHMLAGFSIFGIVFGGGSGKYAAEWIVDGQPSDNMWELDVRRFDDYAARSIPFVSLRVPWRCTGASTRFKLPRRRAGGRSPAQDEPAVRQVDGQRGRLRRALRVGASALVRQNRERQETSTRFAAATGTTAVGEECRAVSSSVGVLDQASFAKFDGFRAGRSAPSSTLSVPTSCPQRRADRRSPRCALRRVESSATSL